MARKYKKELEFKTRWYHRTPRYWFQKAVDRPEGEHDFPEMLRLPVERGVTPVNKPPVRIFLGTETAQYRAERAFVWSIRKFRNPARVYEIYLMKELKGYDRSGWKTSFTNYRYGIPAMAGGTGRAIYHDTDQVYLSDPAELFDLEMNGAGMLCITERETSVMLIDCAKMAAHWTLKDAQGGRKHTHFRDIAHDRKLWGKLPGEWNARDGEYVAGQSKCFHFTTLQTQPWQPFPEILRYEPHPNGDVWFNLEREADKAGFTIFTRTAPSRRYTEMAERYRLLAEADGGELQARRQPRRFDVHAPRIRELVAETGSASLLDYGADDRARGANDPAQDDKARLPSWPGVTANAHDPLLAEPTMASNAAFDGAISVDLLQHVPEGDVGWMLDQMFAAARRFVYVGVSGAPSSAQMANGMTTECIGSSADWWKGQLELASNRNPGMRWALCVVEDDKDAKGIRTFEGGIVARAA